MKERMSGVRRKKVEDSFPYFSLTWSAEVLFIYKVADPTHQSALKTEGTHSLVLITSPST